MGFRVSTPQRGLSRALYKIRDFGSKFLQRGLYMGGY